MRALLLLLVLLTACLKGPAPAATSPTKHALDNLVALQIMGRTFCSGVIVKDVILTAHHCVAVGLFSVEYRGQVFPVAEVIEDQEQDLAIVRLHSKLGDGVPVAKQAPDYGHVITALGHPLGRYEYSLTRGVVSHPRRVGSGLFPVQVWMQHDAAILGGNSGGPIINLKGELVGITSWGALDQVECLFDCNGLYQNTDVNAAVHLESIRGLLAERL